MKTHKRFIVAALLAVIFLTGSALRVAAQSEEGVRAAFLFNFAKLTEWPASAFPDASAKITVGFVDAPSLADTFEKNVTGKNANGREIAVKKLGGAGDIAGCQIVVFGGSGSAAAAQGKPVLTVGEGEAFAKSGGLIGFVTDGPKVTFVVNAAAAKAAGLKVDEKLQKVAKAVL